MTRRKPGILAAAGLALAIFGASPALAASPTPSTLVPRLGLGAGPSTVILDATHRTGSFSVYNAGDADETITITAADFTIDASGNRVMSTEPTPMGAASWVKATPAVFTLKPTETQKVGLAFTVPANATPGDHYTLVSATATLSDPVWKELSAKLGDGVVLRTQAAFPITGIVRVPGALQNDIRAILDLPQLVWSMSDEQVFSPRIEDHGNTAGVWVVPQGQSPDPVTTVPTLKFSNTLPVFGGDAIAYEQQKTGAPSNVTVLPGANKTQQITLRNLPILASYDVTYTLPGSQADGRPDVTETGHVVIVNVPKLLLFVVLPLVLLVLLVVAILLNRRRRATARRREAERLDQERERMRIELLLEMQGDRDRREDG